MLWTVCGMLWIFGRAWMTKFAPTHTRSIKARYPVYGINGSNIAVILVT